MTPHAPQGRDTGPSTSHAFPRRAVGEGLAPPASLPLGADSPYQGEMSRRDRGDRARWRGWRPRRMRGKGSMTAAFLGIGYVCPFLTGQKGTKKPPRRRKVRYVSFPADAENCTSLPCSSLPPLAFGHFPLTGGIGLSQPDPLTLGSGWGPITHSRPPMLPPCVPSGECKGPHGQRRLARQSCLVRRYSAGGSGTPTRLPNTTQVRRSWSGAEGNDHFHGAAAGGRWMCRP